MRDYRAAEALGQDPDGCDGCHRAAGRLLVAVDCQGCCDWLVDLRTVPDLPLPGLAPLTPLQAADPADPPVWLADREDPAAAWSLAAPSFSAYAYAEAWDLARSRLPHYDIGWFPDHDKDLPLAAIDLTPLQRGFVAGPRSYGWTGCFGGPGLVVHRFERPGQRMRVAVHPRTAEWQLAAETTEQLQRLVELLTADNPVLAREFNRRHEGP